MEKHWGQKFHLDLSVESLSPCPLVPPTHSQVRFYYIHIYIHTYILYPPFLTSNQPCNHHHHYNFSGWDLHTWFPDTTTTINITTNIIECFRKGKKEWITFLLPLTYYHHHIRSLVVVLVVVITTTTIISPSIFMATFSLNNFNHMQIDRFSPNFTHSSSHSKKKGSERRMEEKSRSNICFTHSCKISSMDFVHRNKLSKLSHRLSIIFLFFSFNIFK